MDVYFTDADVPVRRLPRYDDDGPPPPAEIVEVVEPEAPEEPAEADELYELTAVYNEYSGLEDELLYIELYGEFFDRYQAMVAQKFEHCEPPAPRDRMPKPQEDLQRKAGRDRHRRGYNVEGESVIYTGLRLRPTVVPVVSEKHAAVLEQSLRDCALSLQ